MSDLAAEFDWVPAAVIRDVLRHSAVTLAVVAGEAPEPLAVYDEARERLARATVALARAPADPAATIKPTKPSADTASR